MTTGAGGAPREVPERASAGNMAIADKLEALKLALAHGPWAARLPLPRDERGTPGAPPSGWPAPGRPGRETVAAIGESVCDGVHTTLYPRMRTVASSATG
jgi:hypothetical protein